MPEGSTQHWEANEALLTDHVESSESHTLPFSLSFFLSNLTCVLNKSLWEEGGFHCFNMTLHCKSWISQ